MAFKDRLRRLEKAAGEHTLTLYAADTGERIEIPGEAFGDPAMRVLAAAWRVEVEGGHSDGLVSFLEPYLERGLVDEGGESWPLREKGGMHVLA
jgi:hypothetical protein